MSVERTVEHGSEGMYQRGCRNECPGGVDGKTCRQAHAEYRARRRAVADSPERWGAA